MNEAFLLLPILLSLHPHLVLVIHAAFCLKRRLGREEGNLRKRTQVRDGEARKDESLWLWKKGFLAGMQERSAQESGES